MIRTVTIPTAWDRTQGILSLATTLPAQRTSEGENQSAHMGGPALSEELVYFPVCLSSAKRSTQEISGV